MKSILFFTILIISFISCTLLKNYNTDDLNTDKIIFSGDSSLYPPFLNIKEINFSETNSKTNSKFLKLENDEFAILSPSHSKVAILKPPAIGDSLCEVIIYNNYGEKMSKMRVEPLSGLSISDQGKIYVYGHPVFSDYISLKSTILFYNSKGEKINKINYNLGSNCVGQFSINEKYFVLLADSVGAKNGVVPKEILLFNSNQSLLIRSSILEWPKLFELYRTQIIIDEKLKNITLQLERIDDINKYRKTLVLDFLGNKTKEMEGWQK